MRLRFRLLLFLIRVLAPEGIGPYNVPMAVGFSSGKSKREDPRLCMHFALDSTKQPILSIVLDSSFTEVLAEAQARLDKWVAGEEAS